MHLLKTGIYKLQERRAQVLLPSVLLVPLFILVVYLLFDLANLSMSKAQHQFALDNAAYTQVTSVSSYLNAMAMINGPALYRVMLTYQDTKIPRDNNSPTHEPEISIFDLFYRAGVFPSLGPDHEKGINPRPSAESTNWDFQFYPGNSQDAKRNLYPMDNQSIHCNEGDNCKAYNGQKEWAVPQPQAPEEHVPLMNWDIIYHYQFKQSDLINYLGEVLQWSLFQGSIYESQNYMFKQVTKNAYMFREGYAINVKDCKPSECAKESARVLAQQLKLNTLPFEIDNVLLYFTDMDPGGWHQNWIAYPTSFSTLYKGKVLYLFNYFSRDSFSKLRNFEKGVTLKQPYKTPANHFRKNLDKKYKPFTRVTVFMSCPRKGNNCVWPNPLPKYNVVLRP